MIAAYSILQAALEKISARIAVSEYARRTLVEHLGGDAVVIPNGVDVDFFARRRAEARVAGRHDRLHRPHRRAPQGPAGPDEGPARRSSPSARTTRLLVAGRGDEEEAVESLPAELRSRVEFLGMVSDEDKARLLRSVDLYVAPNTGGESFGIILVEAMSAGPRCSPATWTRSPRSWTRARRANCSPTRTRSAGRGRGTPPRRPGAPGGTARARQRARTAVRLVDGRRGHPRRSTRR